MVRALSQADRGSENACRESRSRSLRHRLLLCETTTLRRNTSPQHTSSQPLGGKKAVSKLWTGARIGADWRVDIAHQGSVREGDGHELPAVAAIVHGMDHGLDL